TRLAVVHPLWHWWAGVTIVYRDEAHVPRTARDRSRPRQPARGTVAALLALFASAGTAFAVPPLVTDDADTVERGHLQLNAGWQLTRSGAVSLHAVPV